MADTAAQILLVEDDPADRELTLHALRHNKVANDIAVARDGAEALEFFFGEAAGKAPASAVKLILLDLKLPKVDGLQVLKRLKTDPRTKFIPVVVLTSSDEQQDLIRSYDLGVNSYLRKPVDFDDFQEVVRQLGLYWLVVNVTPASAAAGKQTKRAKKEGLSE